MIARRERPVSAPRTRLALVPGLPLLGIGLAYLAVAFAIPEPVGGYATVGPRAFPMAVGVGFVLAALAVIRRPEPEPDRTAPLDHRRVLACIVALVGYVALFETAGFLLTTAVFVPTTAAVLGSRARTRDVVVGVLSSITLWVVLDQALEVGLPAGWLGW